MPQTLTPKLEILNPLNPCCNPYSNTYHNPYGARQEAQNPTWTRCFGLAAGGHHHFLLFGFLRGFSQVVAGRGVQGYRVIGSTV